MSNPFQPSGGDSTGGSNPFKPSGGSNRSKDYVAPAPQGGYIPEYGGEPYRPQIPPTTVDQTPGTAAMIRRMEESGYIDSIADKTFKTVTDILQTFEFASAYGDVWRGSLEASAETSPTAALQLAISADNTTEALNALAQSTEFLGFDEPLSDAALREPNVAVYLNENQDKLPVGVLDMQLGILAALPSTRKKARAPTIGGALSMVTEPVSEFFNFARDPRDYREELAAEMTVWLRDRPDVFKSEAEMNRYLIHFWQRGQEKLAESEGRSGFIGRAGQQFDVGVFAVDRGANEIINMIHAPNDSLNRQHLSSGYNMSAWLGASDAADPGSSFLNEGWAKAVLNGIKYLPTVAMPGAALVSQARGEGFLVETPFVTPIIEEMQAGTSQDFVSGAWDFGKYIWGDPINYVAGAGFGVKAITTTPRSVSRGRAIMQSVVPFFGPRMTGVRYQASARLTWALGSRSWDEMVDVGRLSHNGQRTYDLFRTADSPEAIMRRVPSLRNNKTVPVLIQAAKMGDNDNMFWDTLRWLGGGAHDTGSASTFGALEGLVKENHQQLFRSAQSALDNGQLGIRDVRNIAVGAIDDTQMWTTVTRAPVDPDDVVDANRGVVDRLKRGASSVAGSPTVQTFTDKAGEVVEIRQSGRVSGAFIGDQWVGGLEMPRPTRAGLPPGDPNWGVLPEFQNRGIGNAILDAAPGGRAAVEASPSLTAQAQVALGKVDALDTGVLALSPIEGDGARKAVPTMKRGWTEIDASDPNFVNFLSRGGHQDLAAKLQFAEAQLAITGNKVLSNLDEDEIAILRGFLDRVADGDALRFGDEMIVGKNSQRKLLWGDDLAEQADMAAVLPDEMAKQAAAFGMTQLANGRYKELDLINRMPTISNAAVFGERVSRRLGIQGRGSVAQFVRRTRSGIANTAPTEISIIDKSQGGADLRRFMRLMGASNESVDTIMGQWWDTVSSQQRRTLVSRAIRSVGEEIEHPILTWELFDWDRKQGVVGFLNRSDARGGGAIGAAENAAGEVYDAPLSRMHMQTSVPLPDVAGSVRELKRYRRAGRLPKNIIEGTNWFRGDTGKRRQALVGAYRQRIVDKFGVKSLEEFGTTRAIQDQNMLSIAYADVMGFQGRANGLGLVNRMARVPAKGYNIFHSTFTIAQLAFRPFAWASRVNLEEHVRAFMMGLPTLTRNPALYGYHFWDAHRFAKAPEQTRQLLQAAQSSATDLFRPGADVPTVLRQADEIMPGWAAKVEESGFNTSDVYALRAQWSHDLANSLIGGEGYIDLANRGNMTRRTMLRSRRLKGNAPKLQERYGLEVQDFDWFSNVPEITNKSNVWMLADEMQSAVKDVDWVHNMRPADISTYSASYSKKLSQAVNDEAGAFVLKRMDEQMNNRPARYTAELFRKQHGGLWDDVKDNIRDVARFRGENVDGMGELGLIDFYLDTVWRDDVYDALLKPMWGEDLNEKFRLVTQLSKSKQFTAAANGVEHSLDLRPDTYADSKTAWMGYFADQHLAKNFEFPTVSGYFQPLFGNSNTKNPFKKFTNFMLRTFGEDVSQRLHRRPAYLFERQRVRGIYERLGWTPEDANHIAHQKAFETVNYTFFNNQHTGMLLHRMNKVVPFFSAWAEVMSTWAWKIPSQNFLPLGYARMIHRAENVLQGFVKLGLVEKGEDDQWHLNLEEAPSQTSPLGRGLSRAGLQMMQTPITVVETIANIGGELAETAGLMEDFDGVEFGDWKKDNYQIAIGSPVRVNTHGVMGVNQFNFGVNPALSAAGFAATDLPGISHLLQRLPFAGDTTLVEGNTLEEVYENLPTDIAVADFLRANERVLIDRMGEAQYGAMFDEAGRQFLNPASIDTEGLALQIPGSSWLDGMVDDFFFPFGKVEGWAGPIRQLVPSSLGYMLRGWGLHENDDPGIPGWLSVIMSPFEEYQISAEMTKALVNLEVQEGVITEAVGLADQIWDRTRLAGFDSPEELRDSLDPESAGAIELAELENQLKLINDGAMKRATDNAGMAIFARGLMGLFSPASPRMYVEEQKVTGQFWGTKEMTEAARERGSLSWAESLKDIKIQDEEDFNRVIGLVGTWLTDESGDEVKAWFGQQYPSLMAWISPTTFWGPAGAPPQTRDMDSMFDDIEEGRRLPYPQDVMYQRVARSGLAASHNSLIIAVTGTNDPVLQAQWALEHPADWADLNDDYRKKLAGLDWWDSELNGGAYIDWKKRNDQDLPTLYEAIEDQIYELEDAADAMFALLDNQDLDPEDERLIRSQQNIALRNYRTVLNEFLTEMKGEREFRNPREEIIAAYYADNVAGYYEGLNEIYDGLDAVETKEERSAIYEEARDYQNIAYSQDVVMDFEGREVVLPNELNRVWEMKSPEDQEIDLKRWTGRKVEWLNDFQLDKLAQRYPAAAEYLPLDMQSRNLFANATQEKNRIIADSRADPQRISKYERGQLLTEVDDQLQRDLLKGGYDAQVTWLNAWPIERLMLARQLPGELREIGEWYMGIKKTLGNNGPQSDVGRGYFLSFTDTLERDYLPQNDAARQALDKLGKEMFSEDGRYAVYARLYGQFVGELE